MCASFNIFTVDAEDYLARSRARNRMLYTEPQDTWPLLYAAIENDVDIMLIKEIIVAYKKVWPASLDGMWGESLSGVPPPMLFAGILGKPLVVRMLEDEGATRQVTLVDWSLKSRECCLQGFTHIECIPVLRCVPRDTTTWCWCKYGKLHDQLQWLLSNEYLVRFGNYPPFPGKRTWFSMVSLLFTVPPFSLVFE
jgi:hypothetical protein